MQSHAILPHNMTAFFISLLRWLFGTPAHLPISANDIHVIDGDTIQVGFVTYRLLGFDAPETYRSACPHEYALGMKATNKLQRLIDEARTLAIEDRGHDKYKRRLAVLYLEGMDVADLMIRPGYAVPYNATAPRQVWCSCRTQHTALP